MPPDVLRTSDTLSHMPFCTTNKSHAFIVIAHINIMFVSFKNENRIGKAVIYGNRQFQGNLMPGTSAATLGNILMTNEVCLTNNV